MKITVYVALCYEDSKHGYRIADGLVFSTLEKAKEYRKTTLWDLVDIIERDIDCAEHTHQKVY